MSREGYEGVLRARIAAAINEEGEAGSDYAETARIARALGHEEAAEVFERARADEMRHHREFKQLLRDLG
jgi:rubrerythrin